MVKRIKDVAVLVENSRAHGRNLCSGISRYAQEAGDWCIHHQELAFHEPLPAWIRKWRGSGILAYVGTRRLARQLKALRIPVVDALAWETYDGIPSVSVDHKAVGALAAHFFTTNGFSHFAFCGYNGIYFSDWRRDAFVASLAQHGFSCHLYAAPARNTPGDTIRDRENRGFKEESRLARWIASLPHPVALMTCNDVRAQQVASACLRTGIHVPDDVAILGVDNDAILCSLAAPPLSSVETNAIGQGYQAARLLDTLMDGRRSTCRRIEVPPACVVERQSTDIIATNDRDLAKALRFMRTHVAQGVTVKDVVKHVAKSRGWLDSRLRKHRGSSLKGELELLRIERIRLLLRETNLSLSRIATQVGLQTASHLGVFFKRLTGETPGAYRDSARKAARHPVIQAGYDHLITRPAIPGASVPTPGAAVLRDSPG